MLERRLYVIILWTAISMSILSIVGNIIGGFPRSVNLKWIVLAVVSISCFLLTKSRNNLEVTKLFFFLFIIIVFLPFSFFDSGGSANNSIAYIFLILTCIIYLFEGIKRKVLVGIHILVFIVLHIAEYKFPQLVKVYPAETQFVDRLVQIPLIMFAVYLIVNQFANAYLAQKREQEKANERLEKLADYDSMTNLFNRRSFGRELDNLYRCFPESNSVYIALMDIDYFKHINDQLGHHAGDYVLKEFANALKTLIHTPNFICRWGGDEFALLFHGDKQSLEAILKQIQKSYAKVTSHLEIKTGISIGAALWEDGTSAEEIMKQADMRLYKVKSKNGGQFTFGDSFKENH